MFIGRKLVPDPDKARRSLLELGGKATHIRNSSFRGLDNVCSLVKIRPFGNTYLDEEYNALEHYRFTKEGKRSWKKTDSHGAEATVKCYPKVTTQELKLKEIGPVSSEGSVNTIKIPGSTKEEDSNFEECEEKEALLGKTRSLLSFHTARSIRQKPSQQLNRQSRALALKLSPCSYPALFESRQETDKITNMINKHTFSKKPVKKAIKSIRIVLPRPNDTAKDLAECSTLSNTFNGYKVSQNRRKNAKALSTKIPEWKRKLTLPMVTVKNETKREKSFIQIRYSKEVDKQSFQTPTAKIVEIPNAACPTHRPAKEAGCLRGKKMLTPRHFMQNSYGPVSHNDEFLPVVKPCFKPDALTDADSQRNLRLRYVRR
eukprot:Seg2861.4 transcript_id=Seg2861.4/GoldUCD/mRNA.D3Y31 product="hypothetical protein" protein_id=Seg2861.4/GoldUCD/D3Y31